MTSNIVPLGLEREVKQTHRAIIMLSAVPGGFSVSWRSGWGGGGAAGSEVGLSLGTVLSVAGNQPERRWKGFGGK